MGTASKEGVAGVTPALLAAASGVLLALSLPPFDQEWLGWIALVPLFLASPRRRPLEAVGLGMVTGLTCGALLVPLNPQAHGFIFALFPFLMLALLLGLGTLAAGWARRRGTGSRWVAFLACTGVALEWLTLAGPMPLQLALCQWRNLALIQIVSLTGIWGVSLLLWLSNAAVADLLLSRRWRTPTAALLLLPVAAWLFGAVLTPRGHQPRLHVAAAQTYSGQEGSAYLPPGVPVVEPGDPEQMSRTAAARGARLIVWPELSASFSPDAPEDPALLLARKLKAELVVGYPEPGTPKGYNCAALIGADGRVRGVHRKNYPFLGERRDTNAGTEATAFDTDLGRLGVAICFDTCYPELLRRLARSGAQLIAMPNYDPVAPGGLVHRLHGAVLPFRAVENRIPIVRCDANGMSQVIDATGRVLAQGTFFQPQVVDAEVALGDGKGTLFSRSGDWLPYLCLLGLLGFGRRSQHRPLENETTVASA
jgi:apolipoprotein N-acyltransferase